MPMILVQTGALIFVVSVLVSFFTIPVSSRIATKFNAIDYPAERRINTKATPRMGGISIFLAMSASFIILALICRKYGLYFRYKSFYKPINFPLLYLSMVIVFVTGCFDDVKQIRPVIKLLGQIIAACIAVAAGLVIKDIHLAAIDMTVDLGNFSYVITVLYLVSFANIVNLIDGMDGLAAGTSVIAGTALVIIAFSRMHWFVVLITLLFIGSILGFLKYNFHPAQIFLGDSGSLLIGFAFGVLSLLGLGKSMELGDLLCCFVMFAVPICDTFCAIVRRRRMGVSVGRPDKGHIHHRLLMRGYNQLSAVLHIYMWSAVLGFLAIVISISAPSYKLLMVIFVICCVYKVATKYELYFALED